MEEIIQIQNTDDLLTNDKTNTLLLLCGSVLEETRAKLKTDTTLCIPIEHLAGLGAGVSPLIPAFQELTASSDYVEHGLFRLSNVDVSAALTIANNCNYWGAFTDKSAAPSINPATIMMAATLYTLEKKSDAIYSMQDQVLTFLEDEKESEIEGDANTLLSIVSRYKLNWNNSHFISNYHKLSLDIQRTSRQNLSAYQKAISDALKGKLFLVAKNKVNSVLTEFHKNFNYYRLSLYSFALSSVLETLLSGNFNEENMVEIQNELHKMADEYLELFHECSIHLEKLSSTSIENNAIKGLGNAGKAVGKFIGSIPLIKEGQVDEFLQEKGANLKENAQEKSQEVVKSFSSISNPNISVLLDELDILIQIYGKTKQICFDHETIYLIS